MSLSYDLGIKAEQLAARFLINKMNMTILEHRYQTYVGEIDLLAIDSKKNLVAVEIKKRRTIDQARMAIHTPQRRKIEKAVEIFLCRNWIQYEGIRFDAFLFNSDLSEKIYVPNAWQP